MRSGWEAVLWRARYRGVEDESDDLPPHPTMGSWRKTSSTVVHNESSKYSKGISLSLRVASRCRRADPGKAEMVEAMSGRALRGISQSYHARGRDMETVSKCGEKKRSAM